MNEEQLKALPELEKPLPDYVDITDRMDIKTTEGLLDAHKFYKEGYEAGKSDAVAVKVEACAEAVVLSMRGFTHDKLTKQIADVIRKHLQPASESVDKDKLLELAWGIIANANSGDWKKADSMWEEAAVRWRDAYHRTLPQPPAKESK